ncbi:Ribosomal protein S12 methylthiotransferase RimO [Candidatus Hydrogenisulfobacillus filiaventi]|uniref:Ribosomal protein uS12 methylthiotransferase RimO n=1 Tax=Candidatus Hydrogenisulfobacillus filiaventi TaxID=2707344 RepID=A0A6F8ZFW6_9FIRM|nr:Ribosomal protein S12 methylthiotransferase RimO [Candidatus Hydrogenisulfobacillus filiaventi]
MNKGDHGGAAPLEVGMVSLGCPKNRVDSETMLGLLEEAGYRLTARAEEADVLIINTCGFIDAAKRESVRTILEMAELKQTGRLKALVVAGCLSQRYRGELWQELPEVDAMVGTGEFGRIVEAVEGALAGSRPAFWGDTPVRGRPSLRRLSTPAHLAYVKIAEGCDHTCAFCAIPLMRGGYRSRPLGDIVAEVRGLAARGVREVVLVAQDTTLWGHDLYGRPALDRLLYALAEVPGILWIRLLYSYPTQIGPGLLRAMRDLPQVAPYLDLPLQHAHSDILRAMRRPFRQGRVEEVLAAIREAVPDITLRTTFIVGFPGEAEEHVNALLDFVARIRFEHVGVFTYSPEEGTGAAPLGDPVPRLVKERRRRRVLLLQRSLLPAVRGRHVGRRVPLLVEQEGEAVSIARGPMDAPDIDGVTLLRGRWPAGTVVPARITGVDGYDLLAEAAP